jgi:hypothetical protein
MLLGDDAGDVDMIGVSGARGDWIWMVSGAEGSLKIMTTR